LKYEVKPFASLQIAKSLKKPTQRRKLVKVFGYANAWTESENKAWAHKPLTNQQKFYRKFVKEKHNTKQLPY